MHSAPKNPKHTKRESPLLVFIGPSGAGKSSIIKKLLNANVIELLPTWTDRPQRPDEEVLEHRFVSPRELDTLAQEGFFAHEPVKLFDLPYRYALPKIEIKSLQKIPTVMSRIMLLELMNRVYPEHILYQIEAPIEDVTKRLEERLNAGVEIGSRLQGYTREVEAGRKYAHRVFLNDSDLAKLTENIQQALIEDFYTLHE